MIFLAFSLAHFMVRTQREIHMAHDICALCVTSKTLANSRLLAVKFGGSQKTYTDFQLCRGFDTQTPVLSKGQLHIYKAT